MLLKKLGSFLVEILQVVVFAISIFLFIYLLVMQPHKIKGSSMEPNFHDGEYLLTDKVSYRFGDPQRGEVIVFKAPPDFKDEFIKRIIGIPGDQVMVKGGHVYLNDEELVESYLPDYFITQAGKIVAEGAAFIVPEGTYLVFGDNRNHSYDSRNFGSIDRDKIVGRAWFVYWPPSQMGVISYP